MDPVTLASTAVGLLVPVLKSFGDKIVDAGGDAAVTKIRALYERIKRRLTGDPYDEQLLDGVAADPRSESRARNLRDRIAELMEADAEFRAEVEALVQDAERAGATAVSAAGSGITAGGNVSQVAGGDAVGRDKISGDPQRNP